MPISKQLHQLVHSLTKSEKRNLKLFYSRYKNQSNSLQLFDALNNQVEYDEEKLKKLLKNPKLVGNLNYEKSRLLQMVLDFLAHQASSKEPAYLLNNMHNQVLALVNKQLWDLAIKITEKGIKLAEKHERTFDSYRFHKLRLNLTTWEENCPASFKQKLEDKLNRLAEVFYSNNQYEIMYVKMTEMIHFEKETKNFTPADFEWLIHSPYFQDENKAITFNSKVCLFDTKASYFEIIKDWEQSIVYQKKIIDLYESSKTLINNLHDFFVYQFNYVRILLFTRKFKEAESQLHVIEHELHPQYESFFQEDIANIFDSYLLTMKLELLKLQHNYAAIYEYTHADIHDKTLNYSEMRKVEALAFSVMSCFALEKYDEGITHLNLFEKEINIDLYQKEYFVAKMFSFLCYYENGQSSFLTSIKNAFYYYCRKHELQLPYMQVIQKILRKLSLVKDEKMLIDFFVKVKPEFLKTTYKNHWGGELFLLWMESKIEQQELATIIEKHRMIVDSR